METYYIKLIINFLLMITLIITAKDIIFKRNKRNEITKKISISGWILLLLVILTIGSNYYLDKDSFQQQKQWENNFYKSQKEIKDKVDSTYMWSFNSTTEALLKYNLAITDSFKSIVGDISTPLHPELLIRPAEKDNPPLFMSTAESIPVLKIQFVAQNGICYNINLDCYLFLHINGIYDVVDSQRITVIDGEKLGNGSIGTYNFIVGNNHISDTRALLFVHGLYSEDKAGKIKSPLNYQFYYNFREKKFIGKGQFPFRDLIKTVQRRYKIVI